MRPVHRCRSANDSFARTVAPPWQADASNRVSGNSAAIYLGERLFFDKRLSADDTLSCGQCHTPDLRWTDERTRAVGRAVLDRNTPHLDNVRLNRWFGWDGGNDSLWSQSIQPILDPRELGASPQHVVQVLERDADLRCRYEKSFGKNSPARMNWRSSRMSAKRLLRFRKRLAAVAPPLTNFATLWLAMIGPWPCAIRWRRNAACRFLSARAPVVPAIPGPLLPTVSFMPSACRSLPHPGGSTPAVMRASSDCRRIRSTYWAASMMIRNDPLRPAPVMSRASSGTMGNSGRRHCAMYRRPIRICTTGRKRHCATC
ncbi:MAG: hypothetical protein EXR39_06865 [Betaproteobacteria bacterium]|nr:hypothetical protein [Betaproteobacteria bacterium]